MSNKKIQNLKTIEAYRRALEKLTVAPWTLSYRERVLLLEIAITLSNESARLEYGSDSLRLAYWIILKYSLAFKDYRPLYDFSINLGLYPTAQAIERHKLIQHGDIASSLLYDRIAEDFQKGQITETYEQKIKSNMVIDSQNSDVSYIAPTSYGKSSVIVERIQKNFSEGSKKVAIIVPTKSLLSQTYKKIRSAKFKAKIIVHDEMYAKEEKILCILTQERALRLLLKANIAFDVIYIDEAHNLLNDNNRSVLLARLIKLNSIASPSSSNVYLSPLIQDSACLKIDSQQTIEEHRIVFDLKEPEYYEYFEEGSIYKYNKFLDSFIPIDGKISNIFSYISKFSSEKSFCYLYSPKKIEQFAYELAKTMPSVEHSQNIKNIVDNLKTYVHEDFVAIECIKHGIVFLHGKMPDEIKDYLEFKYSQTPELKYVIANKVILEGVNMPITSLFILNGTRLHRNDLVNLIGRVNRLDRIFSDNSRLELLMPKIHFVNSETYNRKNGNLESKIRLLRDGAAEDIVDNPVLVSFDIENAKKRKKNPDKIREIVDKEKVFFSEPEDDIGILKKQMIALGLNNIYALTDELCSIVYKRIDATKTNEHCYASNILDRLRHIFIRNLTQYIIDDEFARLTNDEAIRYYKMFFDSRDKTLKENIAKEIKYYEERIERGLYRLYVGESYGEIPFADDKPLSKKVCVDLRVKSRKEKINIAIRKRKMEEDFVNFKLNMFFQLMFDYGIIKEEEYNRIMFGTNDEKEIELIKNGLPLHIIRKLKKDNKLQNIIFDSYGNLAVDEFFEEYRKTCDDFYSFELSKIL